MGEIVSYSLEDGIAVVTIVNPPVNAMDRGVRAGLDQVFTELRDRKDVKAAVLGCAGRTFVAGADIKEFDTGIAEPGFHKVLRLVEDSPVPVVAAVHGTALGAGTELAMSCHYRVVDKNGRFGLPELSLGIIPGAGGTQRLPRLVPLERALDIILSGRPVGAEAARDIGLADAVVEGDVIQGAVAFARDLIAKGAGPRRTREQPVKGAENAEALFAQKRAEVAKKMRNRQSPLALIETLERTYRLPFDEGLKIESEQSSKLEKATESRALRHLFFAEREVRKIPGISAAVKPRAIRKVGIVGAGTMGGGIAMSFANIGVPVTVLDLKQDFLDTGFSRMRKNYERSVSRGSLKADQADQRMGLIQPTLDEKDLGDADLIIEAVFENMALKKDIFRKLDQVAKDGAILGTNTSTLDIDEIGAVTSRPQDIVGLHFFSPAHVMPLLEIVQTKATSPEVLTTALDVAKQIRKVGVVSKVSYGFIGNRMMDPYAREAEHFLLEGATPEQVDGALEDFGMAMGILAVFDMAGVEVGPSTRRERKHLLPKDPGFYRCSDLLVERGWLGQKTGRGYYRYDNPGHKRMPNPEANEMFWEEGKRLGVERRNPDRKEMQERCFFSMINEGALLLEEGVALRAGDIDVVYASGYGFPRYRGGPMFYADTVGLKVIHDRILEFKKILDPQYWTPAPLLAKLAAEGSTFAEWDKTRGG
ncbi:MAG: 3-hydroxyacyl-CoA dehydrogenase NAD-binding domain-containing protein [Xanthobacteraceae bacterium]